MKNTLRLSCFFLLCRLLFPLPTASNASPFAPASENRIKIQGASEAYDFGNVSPVRTPTIAHRFVLTNVSSLPLSIRAVFPTCNCVSARLSSSESLPIVVQPGKSISIEASIDIKQFSPGRFKKGFSVFETGSSSPIAEIELTGNALPAARFLPDVIDFGPVVFGDSPKRTITAIIDRSVVPNLREVCAYTTVSSLSVHQLKTVSISKTRTKLVLELCLAKPERIGLFSGEVGLRSREARIGIGEAVQIRGSVIGSVYATPRFANILSVRSAETVVIYGMDDEDIDSANVKSFSPKLSAKLVKASERPADHVAKLILVQKSPVGPSDSLSQVTVVLKSGESLSIPVHLVYGR